MVDIRGLDSRFAPSVRLSSVRFLTYTGSEIERISCKKITNPNTFDSLLHSNIGGLYDPSLGPCDKHDQCGTCGLNYVHCPGHMGHISMPLPVYHPVFFLHLYRLLKCSCWNCHRFRCTPYRARLLVGQLELIEHGLLADAAALESLVGVETADSVDKLVECPKSVLQAINAYIENCLLKTVKPAVRIKAKNMVEFRNTVISDFVKLCSKGVKCTNCSAPVRSIRQENNARIFLKPLTKKNASLWVAEVKNRKSTREMLMEDKTEGDSKQKKLKRKKSAREPLMEDDAEEQPEEFDLSPCEVENLTKQCFVTPLEVKEHIKEMWTNQKDLMNSIVGCASVTAKRCGQEISPTDVFFLDVIPVPPSRFRPIAQVGEKRFENPQTVNLHQVLVDTIAIHDLMLEKSEGEGLGAAEEVMKEKIPDKKKHKTKKLSLSERLQIAWLKLQTDVNCLMDSSHDKGAIVPNGIKQILEKKEGLFRKHMMGKRVDFAARSVISPDPYINMDEIGIPLVFATKLTYPQPVTHWNVKELRQAVMNGPNIHPGASHVQNEDGSVILLSGSNSRQRVAIAKKLLTPSKEGKMGGATKKVFRHLKNGDVLLINRQPTLHKPSIMAHKARVLPGEKTLRLHYANCKSYNADFDGDEMNAHFPQNELARAEAYGIVSTHHQYLVPKDGTPLSGLIQDHVVSGLLMTIRGRFFNRSDYFQLVFSALPEHHKSFTILSPCIMKPEVLWSGKQVISTVLISIVPEGQRKLNLVSKSKIPVKEWGRGAVQQGHEKRRKKMRKKMKYSEDSMTETEVVFRQGELLCGVLDKSQFGASQYGFVHSCNELYGGAVSNLLLSALGRLFTTFLQFHGFTLGVEDILVKHEANEERLVIMAECRQSGSKAIAEALGVENPENKELIRAKYEAAHHSSDTTAIKTLDYFMKKNTDKFNNSINSVCVPAGLHKPFPSNSLQLMVQSGAKGSTVNCMQISCLLGQIELEGQRPPMMASGRFLPSFLPYNPSPRAGGFVDGRFLTGIRPQEYFFHCMAGREGLVDTAVKTSRSGYLQRCLIKHLEGICIAYDMTVRDCDGSIVQFLYGEDGMDIAKTSFLKEKQLSFLADNYHSICHQLNPKSALSLVDSVKAIKYQRKIDHWVDRNGDPPVRPYYSGFLHFCEKHLPEIEQQFPAKKRYHEQNNRTKAQLELIKMWHEESPMVRESQWKKFSDCPVPVNAHLNPDRHFGAIPSKMSQRIKTFMKEYTEKDGRPMTIPAGKFESLVHFKCLRALADPGEAVGLLAAQSIGEPSTQMTLNTFHFAGRGEMNVTLGIPRLREILMTASANIKTPSMDVPLLCRPGAREEGEKLKRQFTRVCLNEVLEKVEVWESISKERKDCHRHRLYKIKFLLLPHQYYKDDFVITPADVLTHIEKVFLKRLVNAINKAIKVIRQKRSQSVSVDKERESAAVEDELSSNEPPDEDDENADISDTETDCVDATSAKILLKKQQHATYEGPGESDEEAINMEYLTDEGDISDEERNVKKNKAESLNESKMEKDDYLDIKEEEEEEENYCSDISGASHCSSSQQMDTDRVSEVLNRSGAIVDYCYDVVDSGWCKVTLRFASLDVQVMLTSVIEQMAAKSVVWETPDIKKGFLLESNEPGEKGVWHLKTDGVNLHELWRHGEILDLNRAYTNNIHAMASTYGIEAAYKAIVKEISGVFKVYGITVDYRHLSLVADYMTYEGSYKAFNRIGLETNSSPLQKMSFETTMHFLKSATISGDTDSLQSPSACLVAGRIVKGGTGSFELMQKLY